MIPVVYYRLSDFPSRRSALLSEPDQIFLQTSSGRQRSPIPRVGRLLKNISSRIFSSFWKQYFYFLSFYSLIRVVLHFMYIKVETENTSVPNFTCAFPFYLVCGGLCIYRREDGSEGSRLSIHYSLSTT